MKRTLANPDLSLLNQGLAATGVQLSLQPDETCTACIPCYFMDNPDGSLRWLWPQNDQGASLLRFYHTGNMRALLVSWLLRFCLYAGLQRFIVSGQVNLYVNDAGVRILARVKRWALFTGTTGENRKLVAWYRDRIGSWFAKMPLSGVSRNNIRNEYAALQKNFPVPGLWRPRAVLLREQILLQSDGYNATAGRAPRHTGDLPLAVFQDWLQTGLKQEVLCRTSWWKSAIDTACDLHICASDRTMPLLPERLQMLMAHFRPDAFIMTADAHGDFTPWNVHAGKEKLTLIDWEFYAAGKPVLYDLFHFIYQDAILVKRWPYATIRNTIDQLLDTPEWQSFLSEHAIDAAQAEQLYLVHTVTYYLKRYSRQAVWHVQVNWLLQTWNEALGYWLHQMNAMQARAVVLQDMACYLHGREYAILKQDGNPIADLPLTSDIDMCICRKEAVQLINWLSRHPLVTASARRKQSFMQRSTLVLADNSLLHLDCIWQVKRRNLVFMDCKALIASAHTNPEGLKVAAPLDDLTYVWLFHLLNKSNPGPRSKVLTGHTHVDKAVWNCIMAQYGLKGAVEDVLSYSPELRRHVVRRLKAASTNRGWRYVVHSAAYIADVCRRQLPARGLLASFSGVDGAGKSTVIAGLSRQIEKELRMPVVVLRHRPSILPILSAWRYGKQAAEQRSVRSLPRQGNTRPGWRSYLRFCYYYADYLLGQFYIQAKYVYRGYVVLYDRYYFDFISDSKRSNLQIPSSVSHYLYRFLIKPDFNYFLFAPAQTILRRKQELDEATIDTLTHSYTALFSKLNRDDDRHSYTSICNLDLETTLNSIFSQLKNHRICAAS